MFVRKVINEQRIPFEVSVDPFYREANMTSSMQVKGKSMN